MNKSYENRMLKTFFAALSIFLCVVCLTVYCFDPFFVYHTPIGGLKEVQKIPQYQVSGVLKNLDYDGVLLGSSTVMSINSTKLAEKYNCRKVVKAVGNSAAAPTIRYYLNLSLDTHRLKYVFYGLDVFSFHNDPRMSPLPDEVLYLNNHNPFDNIEYLLNGEILADKIPDMVYTSLKDNYDPGTCYSFNQWLTPGPGSVLDSYNPDGAKSVPSNGELYQFEDVKANIAALDEVVKNNPGTKFVFMTPCYCIMWWVRAYNCGLLDAYFHTLDYAFSVLLQNSNVEIYAVNFNNKEVITDMYRFADVIHGSPEITEMMLKELGNPQQQITLANYKQHIEKLAGVVNYFIERVNREGIGFLYK